MSGLHLSATGPLDKSHRQPARGVPCHAESYWNPFEAPDRVLLLIADVTSTDSAVPDGIARSTWDPNPCRGAPDCGSSSALSICSWGDETCRAPGMVSQTSLDGGCVCSAATDAVPNYESGRHWAGCERAIRRAPQPGLRMESGCSGAAKPSTVIPLASASQGGERKNWTSRTEDSVAALRILRMQIGMGCAWRADGERERERGGKPRWAQPP